MGGVVNLVARWGGEWESFLLPRVVVLAGLVVFGAGCVSRSAKEEAQVVGAELASVTIFNGAREVRFEGVFGKVGDGSAIVHLRKGGPGILVALRVEDDGRFLLKAFGERTRGKDPARIGFFKPLLGLARGFAMADGLGDRGGAFLYNGERVFVEKRNGRLTRVTVQGGFDGERLGTANFWRR